MDRDRAIVVVLGLGALALFAYMVPDAFASVDPGAAPLPDPSGVSFDPVTGDPLSPDAAAPVDTGGDVTAAVNAMLATIRQFESAGDYFALYGSVNGSMRFADCSKHPFDGKPLPAHSAAGAYQFIIATWKRLQSKLSLPDFCQASQDAAATELLRETGALYSLQNGDVTGAFRAASSQWASLPFSSAGQNPKSLQVAMAAYNGYLAA